MASVVMRFQRCGRIPESSLVPGCGKRAQTERSPVGLTAPEPSKKLPGSGNVHFLVMSVEVVRVCETVLKACARKEEPTFRYKLGLKTDQSGIGPAGLENREQCIGIRGLGRHGLKMS